MPPAETPAESLRALLERGLSELALASSSEQREQLVSLSLLVAAWGQRINLSGHRSAEAIAQRLVLDAAALGAQLPPFESLADLGSGAGFPGLVLAVLEPTRRVLLVEARERRHHFQRAAIRELSLRNTQARRGRAESLIPEPQEAAIAQALARPDRALRWLVPWALPGGWVLLPASEGSPGPTPGHGLTGVRVAHYQVPCGGPRRTLWMAQRPPESQEPAPGPQSKPPSEPPSGPRPRS